MAGVAAVVFAASWVAVVVLATAVAVCVLLLVRPPGAAVRAALVATAVLTGLARVHLGVHWPLDVIGGAGAGVLVATGVVAWTRRVAFR
jgi:undecaprenyl-diphosphatase